MPPARRAKPPPSLWDLTQDSTRDPFAPEHLSKHWPLSRRAIATAMTSAEESLRPFQQAGARGLRL